MQPEEKRNGHAKPRVPETARVTKLEPFNPNWDRAPQVIESTPNGAEALMSGVAERNRHGDTSDLNKLGAPSIGVTIRGQHDAGSCWLSANRFDWFKAKAPETGAISGGTSLDALRGEFCSPLFTIVGGDGSGLSEVEVTQQKLWPDPGSVAGSPNGIAGIEFTVREVRPGSVPILRKLRLRSGTGHVERVVLVNGAEADFETEPGSARPPLIIDFILPQRAVALEFGFITDAVPGAALPFIGWNNVHLIARDGRGNVIAGATSTAEGIPDQQEIIADRASAVIGVRHSEGEIASVELHFVDPADDEKVQIVARIWHEALPPAAVLQGTLVTEGGRGSFAEFTGVGWQLPDPTDRDGNSIPFRTERSRSVPMPFRFNRAVVMLRGFKLQMLDGIPHEVQRIAAEVNPRLVGGPPQQKPGVFIFERGSSVVLEPRGALITRERRPPGYRVHIYFTLVGWDSDQVDVAVEQGEQSQSLQQESVASGIPLGIRDACLNSRGFEGCGELFGALQGFEFQMPRDQEVDRLTMTVGADLSAPGVSGLRAAGFAMVPIEENEIPALTRARSRVDWGFGSFLSGGDVDYTYNNPDVLNPLVPTIASIVPSPYSRTVRGAVMAGPSVRLENWEQGFRVYAFPEVGPRPDPQTFYDDEALPESIVEGDLAFVGLGAFTFHLEDPVRELEVELLGDTYDGRVLRCKLGGGISSTHAGLITGSAFGSGGPDLEGRANAIPAVGCLSRRSVVPRPQLQIQHLEFVGWTGLLTYSPSVLGAIRNVGNIPAVLTNIQRSGPQHLSFMFTLHHRGVELRSWSAIAILPGETLLVGGRFFPATPAEPDPSLYEAFLDFETNLTAPRTLRMNVTGRTIPPDIEVELFPPNLKFGHVRFSAAGPPRRNVIVASIGRSPLLIQSIHFENHNISGGAFPSLAGILSWRFIDVPPRPVSGGALYQVDPGAAPVIEITLAPNTPGSVNTRLILETNVGTLEVPILGEIVSQN